MSKFQGHMINRFLDKEELEHLTNGGFVLIGYFRKKGKSYEILGKAKKVV